MPLLCASGRELTSARTELLLCGHGTLATAHVLYESGRAVLTFPGRRSSARAGRRHKKRPRLGAGAGLGALVAG
jgi:hypothetical protein